MASQRFCLRWNNHQTNLLSVFDQLLHTETFIDVTLAVEGQYLKAHKVRLRNCLITYGEFARTAKFSPFMNVYFVIYVDRVHISFKQTLQFFFAYCPGKSAVRTWLPWNLIQNIYSKLCGNLLNQAVVDVFVHIINCALLIECCRNMCR